MRASCRVCDAALEPFLDLGRMPIANAFLRADQFHEEWFFDLRVGFCGRCGMVQLAEIPDRERLFHDHYPFYSSTSTHMAAHFRALSEEVRAAHLGGPQPFLVEIGSNDGVLLQNLAAAGIRHLGVEPSANVAQAARDRGVRTLDAFFDAEIARRIVAEHGRADVVLAANVMCHMPNLHSVIEGVAGLLKPAGVLVFEDPYLGDIVEKTAYDQFYDEHVFYFSVASISDCFARHGFEVVDVAPQDVHGGSMRYLVARTGQRPISPALERWRARENALGLGQLETYARVRSSVEHSRDELRALIDGWKRAGRRIVGYGATSKSTTVTNYCGLGPELIDFVSDTTPLKQGKYTPGVHIPVRPHAEFAARYPDFALLFAWNHAGEIMAKEGAFTASGGRWIVYVPRVAVLDQLDLASLR